MILDGEVKVVKCVEVLNDELFVSIDAAHDCGGNY